MRFSNWIHSLAFKTLLRVVEKMTREETRCLKHFKKQKPFLLQCSRHCCQLACLGAHQDQEASPGALLHPCCPGPSTPGPCSAEKLSSLGDVAAAVTLALAEDTGLPLALLPDPHGTAETRLHILITFCSEFKDNSRKMPPRAALC